MKRLLKPLLTLSHVPRWGIIDTIKPQSVADHHYRVAVICLCLSDEVAVKYKVNFDKGKILQDAITHDIEEAITSDLPAPFKAELKSLLGDSYYRLIPNQIVSSMKLRQEDESPETLLVKVADITESIIFVSRYAIKGKHIVDKLYQSLDYAIKEFCTSIGDVTSDHMIPIRDEIIRPIIKDGISYE